LELKPTAAGAIRPPFSFARKPGIEPAGALAPGATGRPPNFRLPTVRLPSARKGYALTELRSRIARNPLKTQPSLGKGPLAPFSSKGGPGISMIKSELIARLANENPHLTQKDVERVVGVILERMIGALEDGGRVELRGFGALSVRSRPARTGRNPRTGEAVDVRAKHVPFFKSGKELRERLNADDE